MKKRAVGYIRVSSKAQATSGESLTTQRRAIKDFVKAQGWKLGKTYADEGISGGSVKEREALLQLLEDATNKKFDILVVHRLSRFGRNARDILNNVEELKVTGVEFKAIKEGMDFNTPYGRGMLVMLSGMAQLEREIIGEQGLENRIAKGRKGEIIAGRFPFARIKNKKGKLELDEKKAKLIRWAAKEYLNGGSLYKISLTLKTKHNLPLSYPHLIKVLTQKCGDTWYINFKGEKPISINMPRILDDSTIQAIKDRIAFNRTCNRTDVVDKYLLTGFIRCAECGKGIYGQTQRKKYRYYMHPTKMDETCKAFHSIPLETIDNAVLKTLWEYTYDKKGFNKAIKNKLPDAKYIESLKKKIKNNEKELKKIDKDIYKLSEWFLSGDVRKTTIQQKENELYEEKGIIETELEKNRNELKLLPPLEQIKEDAEEIRKTLLKKFRSEQHLLDMPFDEKKELLYKFFGGGKREEDGYWVDGENRHYGVYVRKSKSGLWKYGIVSKLVGFDEELISRTIKGNNINYHYDDVAERMSKRLNEEMEKDTNESYKTNTQELPTCKPLIARKWMVPVCKKPSIKFTGTFSRSPSKMLLTRGILPSFTCLSITALNCFFRP